MILIQMRWIWLIENIASKFGYQNTEISYSYTSPTTKKVVNISGEEDVKKMVEELPVSRDLEVFFGGDKEKEELEEYISYIFVLELSRSLGLGHRYVKSY